MKRPEHDRGKELLFKRISKTEWYRKKNNLQRSGEKPT